MKQLFRVQVGKTQHLLHAEPGTAFELGVSKTLCGKTKIATIDGKALKRPRGATKCVVCQKAAA